MRQEQTDTEHEYGQKLLMGLRVLPVSANQSAGFTAIDQSKARELGIRLLLDARYDLTLPVLPTVVVANSNS